MILSKNTVDSTTEQYDLMAEDWVLPEALMGGERVTPDDDGMMTPLIEIIVFLILYYFGYF